LRQRIDAGTAPTVLDVRSRWEFARGHLPGAAHIPFWRLFGGVPPLPGGDEPIVVYCGHGPRAWIAWGLLRARGVAAVCLDGHMAGWRRSGGPEERSSDA
jgi:rhodanese-related sulfurtransferase